MVGLFLIAFSLQLWIFLYIPKVNKLFPICWLQYIKPYQQAFRTVPLNSFYIIFLIALVCA